MASLGKNELNLVILDLFYIVTKSEIQFAEDQNNSGEKRPGGGMQQSTVPSRKNGDAGKHKKKRRQYGEISEGQATPQTSCLSGLIPGRTRSPQGCFNQHVRPLPIKRTAETWMSNAKNLSVMTPGSWAWCAWAPTSSDLHRMQRNDWVMIC